MEGDTICNSCGSHPEEKAEEKQEERRLSEERSPLDKATKEIDSKTTDLPMPMPMDTADTKALAVIKTEKEDSFSEKETIISVDENCNTNSEREIIIRSGAKNENDADDSLQREQQAAKTVKEADDRLSLNQRECEDGEKKGEENKDSDLPKAHINNRGQPEAIDIGQAPPPPPLHITNFFIDNILKPDFGRGKVIQKSNALHRVSIENRHCHHHHSDSDSNSICSVDTSSLRSPRNLTSSRTVNDDDDDEGVISPGVHDNRRVSSHYSIHGDSEGVDCDRRSPASQSQPIVWPAWVYCTRYSDRPSSGELLKCGNFLQIYRGVNSESDHSPVVSQHCWNFSVV